jgi:hypothetical protein
LRSIAFEHGHILSSSGHGFWQEERGMKNRKYYNWLKQGCSNELGRINCIYIIKNDTGDNRSLSLPKTIFGKK